MLLIFMDSIEPSGLALVDCLFIFNSLKENHSLDACDIGSRQETN